MLDKFFFIDFIYILTEKLKMLKSSDLKISITRIREKEKLLDFYTWFIGFPILWCRWSGDHP
jgi:hypothetical protein